MSQYLTIVFLVFSVVFSSCSFLRKNRSDTIQISEKQYNILLKENEILKEQMRLFKRTGSFQESKNTLSQLQKVDSNFKDSSNNKVIFETIDPFAKNTKDIKLVKPKISTIKSSRFKRKVKVEKWMVDFDRADSLIKKNKFQDALAVLRNYSNVSGKQAQVRKDYLMGRAFLSQKNYDLALQMFEKVLKRNAFSGLVISSLGYLILCSEKLNLEGQKERYYSLLHDLLEK